MAERCPMGSYIGNKEVRAKCKTNCPVHEQAVLFNQNAERGREILSIVDHKTGLGDIIRALITLRFTPESEFTDLEMQQLREEMAQLNEDQQSLLQEIAYSCPFSPYNQSSEGN